jgi:formylglycine-generating enzyme required for sulfatase activity
MSPEQVAGAAVDFRSDIFSLGALIYELFCVNLMFTGTNMVAVMHQVVEADIGDAIDKLRSVAPALVPVVSRCMALAPKDRYSSAAEVAGDLEAIETLYPTELSLASWAEALAERLDPITGSPLDDDSQIGHSTHADTLLAPTSGEMPVESLVSDAISPLDPEDTGSLIMPPSAPRTARPPSPPFELSASKPAADVQRPPSGHQSERRNTDFRRSDLASTRHRAQHSPRSPTAPPMTARSSIQGVRPWFIVVTLGVSWLVLSALGPALPGETGAVFRAVRDWQVRVLRGEEVPSLIDMVDQAGDNAGIELVQIKAARIQLGSPGERDAELATNEILVPGGLLMTHEVTVADYRSGCSRRWWEIDCKGWPGLRDGQSLTHPVVDVTWSEAKAWCAAQDWRLPTESEWELAARGAAGRSYPWGEGHRPGAANYCDVGCEQGTLAVTWENDGYAETAPVGSFPAGRSPDGAYDLAGNAAEWVLDCWLPHHEGRTTWSDRADDNCIQRTVRGGSWRDSWDGMSAWQRRPLTAETRSSRVGFRCIEARLIEASQP